MKEHKISADLFTFPYRGRYVVYAPFRRLAFMANDATVAMLEEMMKGAYESGNSEEEKKVLRFLKDKGIYDSEPEKKPFVTERGPFLPQAVTLFLTNRCNLRCIYCYAFGGEFRAKDMPWPMAQRAIDWVAENAQRAGAKEFGVAFHGGGEPLVAWKLLQKSVNYARSLAKKLEMSVRCPSATNGVMNSDQVQWVIENLNSLSISLDGTPDMQNRQRPLANGRESYPQVAATIKALDKAGFDYGLRATITDYNVARMPEIVDFFHHNFKTRQVQFEPLFICGRCLTSGAQSPDQRVFLRQFLKAQEKAEKYGINLTYSGLRLQFLTNTFCGAASDNFCVTPRGDVTSCFEVLEKSDPRSEFFFYGKYDTQKGDFQIWEEKRKALLSTTVENIPHCADCIAKWHCAGDCPSKVLYDGGRNNGNTFSRCWVNQEATKKAIVRRIKKQGRAMQGVEHQQNVPTGGQC